MEENKIREIDKCRSCNSREIESFFDFGAQPFANSLLKSVNDQDEFYPLNLCICQKCSLVQLKHTADPEKLFSHYLWVTGTSSTARAYSEQFCEEALAHINEPITKSYVLEIASNDGTYLRQFLNKGIKALGVDPAKNVVDGANAEGIETICEYFGEEFAKRIVRERGKPVFVFARNVLAHVADLHDFLRGILTLVSGGGTAAIEFHYGKVIQDGLHYDSIYHEHLFYFTVGSVRCVLGKFNLEIIDILKNPISGGAIVIYIKEKGTHIATQAVGEYIEAERVGKTNDYEMWKKFMEKSFLHRERLVKIIDDELANGKKIVGYGASARSSTLLNFCGIGNGRIPVIADQNPMKHGLYTAGTKIPIKAPEEVMKEEPDTIIILAWNFFNEIKEILRNRYGYNGRLIVPLPVTPKIVNLS